MKKISASEFISKANELGFKINVGENVISLTKEFEKNNVHELNQAEENAYFLLISCPSNKSSSSIWGTTGDSVGGAIALQQGIFRLAKSAIQKNFLKALAQN